MLFDVMRISFLDTKQIVIRNTLFVGSAAFANVLLQFIYRRMKVNQYIGLNELLMDNLKKPLVKPEFIFGQFYFSKQQAFGEELIRNSNGLKKIFLL